MKKVFFLCFLLIISSILIDCVNIGNNEKKIDDNGEMTITIDRDKSVVKINEVVSLNRRIDGKYVYWESVNPEILFISGYLGKGMAIGNTLIKAFDSSNNELVETYLVNVKEEEIEKVAIYGSQNLQVASTSTYKAIVNPTSASQKVTWASSDENIISIVATALDSSVSVEAKNSGIAVLTATSIDGSEVGEICILVSGEVEDNIEIFNKFVNTKETIDASKLQGFISPLIETAISYTLEIKGYLINANGNPTEYSSGSCVVYKRNVIDTDGNEIAEQDEVKIVKYVYYAITNRHIIQNCDKYIVKSNNLEIEANLIQFDTKIDLAVIRFETELYIPCAKFSESSEVQTGEFCIAVGNPFTYADTATFGIVSYPNRYVADDVDGDGTTDWDAQYIQYDAAINDGNSGGALINMKGYVIGINTTKISEAKVENMSFAIPSNVVLNLVEQLEKGIQPQRPLLGVSVMSVKDILVSEVLKTQYTIPEGITFGMYVAEVTESGVAYKAGIQINDIILKMAGFEIKYSYELRAQLGKCIIGSNEKIEIIVFRDGKEVTLYATF